MLVTKLTMVSTRSLVVDITRTGDQKQSNDSLTKWINMALVDHWHATPVPSLPPLVVCGGEVQGGMPTSIIKIYENSSKPWRIINIASLYYIINYVDLWQL